MSNTTPSSKTRSSANSFTNELVLHNDSHNTMDHVISCVMEFCGHTAEQAEQCTMITHLKGKYPIKMGSYTQLEEIHFAFQSNGISTEIV